MYSNFFSRIFLYLGIAEGQSYVITYYGIYIIAIATCLKTKGFILMSLQYIFNESNQIGYIFFVTARRKKVTNQKVKRKLVFIISVAVTCRIAYV